LENYAKEFHKSDVLVLHIGTFAPKPTGRPGKHLYLMGIRDLLNELKVERRRSDIQGNQLVLISEFGMEHAAINQLYEAVSKRLKVDPCQAILGYYVEQERSAENNRTSLAGIAYAYWFYHWLVRPLAYKDASTLLIALGLRCMVCAPEECEQLLPTSRYSKVTDRDKMSRILIERINQKCAESKDKSEQLTYWATRLLTDAILARVNLYDEKESIKTSVEKQLKRFIDAMSILEEIAKQALSNPLWHVTHVPLFYEIRVLNDRIMHNLRIKNTNIEDKTRQYGKEFFHNVLLYSIVAINYLKMAADMDKVWPTFEGMISEIPDRDEPMLKLIERYFRMENDDWCTVFVTDIGCEVKVSDKILMKTFDGKTLEPREIESEYSAVDKGIRYISKNG
jgi:hypothetical protein